MTDSPAVRQQRRRRHLAGDHSMCTRRCEAARVPVKIAEVPAGSGQDLDPAAALQDLAVQLLAAYRADPGNASLAREARVTLLALAPPSDDGAQAEWKQLMRELATPVYTDEPS